MFSIPYTSGLSIVGLSSVSYTHLDVYKRQEWGEGNYMEPDLTFGKGYINALHEALNSTLGK